MTHAALTAAVRQAELLAPTTAERHGIYPLHRTNLNPIGGAAMTTVEARGCPDQRPGFREHDTGERVGRAAGALLTGQCQDGQSQVPACEQYPWVAHGDPGSTSGAVESALAWNRRPARNPSSPAPTRPFVKEDGGCSR